MAQLMDDLEFLLPSELLTDDDLLTDFSCGFGTCGLSSDLSLSVDSVTGATEIGIHEDDFLSELTRMLTQSPLRHSNLSYDYQAKSFKESGSPQSTLYGFKPPSRGSPNSDSRNCSPPYAKDALSWDLLSAAAEEVAKIRLAEETAAVYSSKLFASTHKPGPVIIPQQKPNPASGFFPNQSQIQTQLSYQQFQAFKFQQMKQQKILQNGFQGPGNMEYKLQHGRGNDGDGSGYILSMSTWPTLQQSQQQTVSGIKSVYVGENRARKERVGTGVFMPRRFTSSPTVTRKKPADRVVHVLNLDMDSIDAQLQHIGVANFPSDYDALLKHRNNVMLAHQRRIVGQQPLMNQEFSLPQEWTY